MMHGGPFRILWSSPYLVQMFDLEIFRLDVFLLRGDYLPFALSVRLITGAALHVYAQDAACGSRGDIVKILLISDSRTLNLSTKFINFRRNYQHYSKPLI
ncbi:hypothetical protein AXF42_Ash003234 [Apostasia shenzhenica]|uniref:Uncharacterized protein n=1 Tax=Apostasia shenzhenica TaxID=1088818 RepID=A0A2I0BFJ9_9ASPA|nr:hypothetical protein AXF42_Ash003234 [Apostasia shenzhenica]